MHFGRIPTVSVGDVPGDGFLLDVREGDEWAAGHAEGAVHVPMSDFLARFAEVTEKAADRRVFVVCRVGGRSAQVTGYLVQQGIEAVNVDGGMQSWVDAGRPLVADGADEPYVL